MGTSSSNSGPNPSTPLLPSWSDSAPPVDPQLPILPAPQSPDDTKPREKSPQGEDNRFRNCRSNFTRYLSSGGRSRSNLGSAIGKYISSGYGGSKNAAKRMGTSKYAAAGLMSYLEQIQKNGLEATLKKISKEELRNKSPREIFAALIDVVCPSDGSIDTGIVRDAFVETVIELEITDQNLKFSDDQINIIVTMFISKSISRRLINDIGNKYDFSNLSTDDANQILESVDNFIFDSVREQLIGELKDQVDFSGKEMGSLMDNIYEKAYEILQIEAEAIR